MSNEPAESILKPFKKSLLFVVSAPAGTGKTTLVQMLLREFPNVKASISCTTRAPREGEIDGVHYHFLTREVFQERIAVGDFLEYVELFGNYYGTSKKCLEAQRKSGSHVILTIDTQGAMQLKNKMDAVFIFLTPPSMEELLRRLVNRKTESEESMAVRFARAEKELQLIDQYDYQIVNDDLGDAYQVLRCVLIAEEHRVYISKSV
jgi:guanylate kinase